MRQEAVAPRSLGPALLLALLAACRDKPADLREWTPADHDQPAAPQGQVAANPSAAAGHAGAGADLGLVELAWQRNCQACHGSRGRGDGPQSAMMRVPDLTRPDWQEKATDAEIAEVIRKGRNRMPAFDLPPQVVEGLVVRIRASRGRPSGD